jgi:hypothetical protein
VDVLALGYTFRMVSEKQFRERTKVELREIGKQVASLATDRDVYHKLDVEVIAKNPRLQNSRSAFLDMLRGAYTDAMAIRVARLTDADNTIGLNLPRVLAQIGERPELLHDKVGNREFANDCAALERAGEKVKEVWDPHASHRTPSALAATHRALDDALDLMISTLKTYYWVVAEGHLDLEPSYGEDPLEIFRFAWMER